MFKREQERIDSALGRRDRVARELPDPSDDGRTVGAPLREEAFEDKGTAGQRRVHG